eukprot:GHVT01019397.1.p1 GENE.GHVT01019397.1~~GHVT01019397.1.p1  ORF type:complete len:126 (-),score=51.08 GHVT01019397.1:367-744(-)
MALREELYQKGRPEAQTEDAAAPATAATVSTAYTAATAAAPAAAPATASTAATGATPTASPATTPTAATDFRPPETNKYRPLTKAVPSCEDFLPSSFSRSNTTASSSAQIFQSHATIALAVNVVT